ncbi:TVG0793261 [Thermoplasma volcanium GSS1]|uniref:TVG0793261 protein n=1 Tax=Thermoplasma volcanium (strain ATCC 51530 / DSM 4299 / JCM 9571 / NBRC 15438 / GSS1) TaxID=273116 RepID=Q97AL8_THEVO|nr:TVG0793261 [Thermoplasma volcanium GSS1]
MLRKRYIVVYSETPELLSDALFRKFRCKTKFRKENFIIVLASQFNKDKVINYINSEIIGSRTLVTSGTMRKCKAYINDIIGEDETDFEKRSREIEIRNTNQKR